MTNNSLVTAHAHSIEALEGFFDAAAASDRLTTATNTAGTHTSRRAELTTTSGDTIVIIERDIDPSDAVIAGMKYTVNRTLAGSDTHKRYDVYDDTNRLDYIETVPTEPDPPYIGGAASVVQDVGVPATEARLHEVDDIVASASGSL